MIFVHYLVIYARIPYALCHVLKLLFAMPTYRNIYVYFLIVHKPPVSVISYLGVLPTIYMVE
jgi:hypothetical protein